jgi:hypothetical protein
VIVTVFVAMLIVVVIVRMLSLMLVLMFISHFLIPSFLLLPSAHCLLPTLTFSTFPSSHPTALR